MHVRREFRILINGTGEHPLQLYGFILLAIGFAGKVCAIGWQDTSQLRRDQ
ncbi:hypothetical protein [Serratia fonticola]|uniref:Uncharacterized protein n=1 Tax=Serratia fonticola TaxID=47917 RepID=A0AAW3WJZ1_SERFO|nr:hypothetical protein [Serratia fonticola]MBC3211188.1 hypothetical protein [Serratia fonticola]NYA12170.1 hypothetical protein [Serratia fonticola]NYA31749.1 hypothetical protein [Serratia fonticola]